MNFINKIGVRIVLLFTILLYYLISLAATLFLLVPTLILYTLFGINPLGATISWLVDMMIQIEEEADKILEE